MARQLQSITSATRQQQRAMQSLNNNITQFRNNTVRSFKEATAAASKFALKYASLGVGAIAGVAGAGVGAAAAKGLSDSMDFEGLRNQLEIATRDKEKAGDVFKWAVKFANTTPFDNKEVVDAAAQLQMQGLDAKSLIPQLGDMAASKSGKTLDDAVQAMLDAQTGELERLKEFGITKQNIIDEGARIMKGKQLVNNKGQITDMKNFLVAMQSLMKTKYSGAMEAQSKTLKGIWDNTKAAASQALVKIWGMQEDGSIKAGSALDKLKGYATKFSEYMNNISGSSKIDEIQQKFADLIDYIQSKIPAAVNEAKYAWNELTGAFNWIKENKDWLLPTLAGVATAFAAQKVASTIVTIYEAWTVATRVLTAAQAALAIASAATPFGWIAAAVGVVVAVSAVLYSHWDAINAKLKQFGLDGKTVLIALTGPVGLLVVAGMKLVENWDLIKAKSAELRDSLKVSFGSAINWVIDKINSLIEKVNLIPGIKIPLIPKIDTSLPAPNIHESPEMNEYATGTNYAAGGPSLVGEQGPEIVNLPRGSQVMTASKTASKLGGSNVNVYVTIQGNMIGNEEYVDYIGERIFKRVQLATTNI
ncbi:hypothetical protein ACYEXS_19690 [Paenibacillus sp. MAH-36]|uniref:Phage tail tape measure protein n=2 Tax=Paenibacillus TaxID=44249 RepID=A0ABU3R7D1_9BACL|nr:hypothetical protein [Paenibacillus sp. PFR10]MDU0200166.1 hypothetical protein [Paenibacillus sp. PFR10]